MKSKKQINFNDWAFLINQVYPINSNGKWLIIFAIIAYFRTFIVSKIGFMPTVFLYGGCGTGKTSIAKSLVSAFKSKRQKHFNLSCGTDAAFSLLMSQKINIVTVLDEYNENTITKLKLQGIKQSLDKGVGTSKLNNVPVIISHDIAEADNYSLHNRVVVCEFPYNEYSESERKNYSYLLSVEDNNEIEIIHDLQRIDFIFKELFLQSYYFELTKLNKLFLMPDDSSSFRIIQSISAFNAVCSIIERHTDLVLPFYYSEFFDLSRAKTTSMLKMKYEAQNETL